MAEKELAVKKKGISSKGEELRAYWMFILPGFIMYFIVMAFPTVFSLFLSISNYAGGSLFNNARNPLKVVGFKAYKVMFQDQYFYLAARILNGLPASQGHGKVQGFLPDDHLSSMCNLHGRNRYPVEELLCSQRCLDGPHKDLQPGI